MVSEAIFPGPGGTGSYPQGLSAQFKENRRYSWGPFPPAEDPLVVLLTTKDIKLFRNICSAILDADRFPRFASTPYWLKKIYQTLGIEPAAQGWLISALLFAQIQAMNHVYGYHESHGRIEFVELWHHTHPLNRDMAPDYIYRLQWWSTTIFSDVVESTCYWAGRMFLGMKGSYEEYTPHS